MRKREEFYSTEWGVEDSDNWSFPIGLRVKFELWDTYSCASEGKVIGHDDAWNAMVLFDDGKVEWFPEEKLKVVDKREELLYTATERWFYRPHTRY